MLAGFYLMPAIREAGPAGGPVIRGLLSRKFPVVMSITGLVAVLSGLRLYTIRFSIAWLATPEGITLTVGALFAIGALFIGIAIERPAAMRAEVLLHAAGASPSPEQLQEMADVQVRVARAARATAWHLFGAAVFMAARSLTMLG